jgi:nitrate/TMAO reductase-like tetraheme cytochrome c subunit
MEEDRLRKPSKLRLFLWPSAGASLPIRLAPYAALIMVAIALGLGGAVGWNYTNSSVFCGTSCHTMPPQYNTFLHSPHSRVSCVECHIGRDSIDVMIGRKVQHSETVYAMLFHTYEYPIVAEKMRPANEACETCHYPRKFSTDSLREVREHANDELNTPLSTFLLLKTGGGAKREGLGSGIHWHIENKVTFYATDQSEQQIPYVRVEKDDGTVQEFIDIDSGFTPAQVEGKTLHKVDCITCHNRITHSIPSPEQSVDTALYTNVLSNDLPFIRKMAVQLLSAEYPDDSAAQTAFQGLEGYYQQNYPQVMTERKQLVSQAVEFLKSTYAQTHFADQKLEWNTHPNNTGHRDSPGCFRCHDGKHISVTGESIRLECNLCHSVPQTADPSATITQVSIVRGAEPASHTHSLWIALHGKAIDETCARCHPPVDPSLDWTQLNGQKPPADGSFCGNSACHQSEWKFAGFQSPGLQPLLQQQLTEIKQGGSH